MHCCKPYKAVKRNGKLSRAIHRKRQKVRELEKIERKWRNFSIEYLFILFTMSTIVIHRIKGARFCKCDGNENVYNHSSCIGMQCITKYNAHVKSPNTPNLNYIEIQRNITPPVSVGFRSKETHNFPIIGCGRIFKIIFVAKT